MAPEHRLSLELKQKELMLQGSEGSAAVGALLQRLSWCAADFFQQPDRIPKADLFVLAR